MTLYPTVAILVAALAVLGFSVWRGRRPRHALDVPLVNPFIVKFLAVMVVVLMVIHLLKLLGMGPASSGNPGF